MLCPKGRVGSTPTTGTEMAVDVVLEQVDAYVEGDGLTAGIDSRA